MNDLIEQLLEKAYLIARGHINPKTLKPRDGFTSFGTRQIYWSGRSDAASDIREAKPSLIKWLKKHERKNKIRGSK